MSQDNKCFLAAFNDKSQKASHLQNEYAYVKSSCIPLGIYALSSSLKRPYC